MYTALRASVCGPQPRHRLPSSPNSPAPHLLLTSSEQGDFLSHILKCVLKLSFPQLPVCPSLTSLSPFASSHQGAHSRSWHFPSTSSEFMPTCRSPIERQLIALHQSLESGLLTALPQRALWALECRLAAGKRTWS